MADFSPASGTLYIHMQNLHMHRYDIHIHVHIIVEKCRSKWKRGKEQSLGHSSWMQILVTSSFQGCKYGFCFGGGGGGGVWGDRVILLDKEFFKSDAYSQTLTKHSDV